MEFVKIENLFKYGTADYKGLSLDWAIPNSQVVNYENNSCVMAFESTNGVSHDDLKVITEQEYQDFVNEFGEERSATLKEQVESLQAQSAQLLLMLVESEVV